MAYEYLVAMTSSVSLADFGELGNLGLESQLDMLGRQDQFEILSKKIANLMEKSETNAEALDPKLLFGTHGNLPCSVGVLWL